MTLAELLDSLETTNGRTSVIGDETFQRLYDRAYLNALNAVRLEMESCTNVT